MQDKAVSQFEQSQPPIKLEQAMLAFLERRNQESFPLSEMQSVDSGDFDFIQISHLSYERERDCSDKNLLDFQQILSAAANIGGGGKLPI